MDQSLIAQVQQWIAQDPDPKTRAELERLLADKNETELRSCFSGFLEFGTAGLRGKLGPGPSRMNRAVVSKTAAGLVTYMNNHNLSSVVIGRDARYGSKDFAQDTAEIMQGAGMRVYLLPEALPTPVLAYAVRELKCDVGIMVTASHNPPEDNGYKVYLGGIVDQIRYEGSQIISPADTQISEFISQVLDLNTIKRSSGAEVLDNRIVDSYIKATAKLATSNSDLKVVYSAMHGVGTKTLKQVFAAANFAPPILVDEQAEPDPAFPTVKFPNPEEPGAIDLSIKKAIQVSADLVIANDPDADRCAVAISDKEGNWRMLRGDEVGAILGEYLARGAKDKSATLANSIVSSSILSKIAKSHQLPFAETLTGFKWIAKTENLHFGYEEALGYAVDSNSVNDKDGISAALMIVQIATDLKRESKTLNDLLDEIWSKYGYHGTKQISVRVDSLEQISKTLGRFRNSTPQSIAGYQVSGFDDLEKPTSDLPPTNGVRIFLEPNIRVIVRPSGTEPKIKCYIEVVSDSQDRAEEIINRLDFELRTFLAA
ncbi:MAG: phospho-sugar mutase [Actinobacteria bacterium]|nr:phospho-sugar mutase [Actinomycetota bacterium]NDE36127.1 phospho-sugar mutase [Actinomycetota bacterium]